MFQLLKSLTCFALCLLVSSFAIAQSNVGSLSGTINYCEKGAVAGVQVFVPGKSHVVITGSDGRFVFSDIPVGKYDLNFMFNGKMLPYFIKADVNLDEQTKLTSLNVCDTKQVAAESNIAVDLTSVLLGELDCATNREGATSIISHGKGHCSDGKFILKHCNTGYADCDADISNGCEIDTKTNAEHCGSCFNSCGDLESCDIGMC